MNLNELNEQQKKAVTAPLGPVLVLAGAGSGKTKCLTYRIAYLIEQGLFTPQQILAVTFTNKAAEEMKERIMALTTTNKTKPSVGTFHSICARILRAEINKLHYYTSNFTIFDTQDSEKILREILKNLHLDDEIKPSFGRIMISSIKNKLLDPDSLEDDRMSRVYRAYEKALVELNALDFDDLLLITYKLFKKHPKILQKYQNRWRYILVDEYQDTNDLQYKLIRQLVGGNENIFAVGDDAQSIYGFRGANFQNILNFERDFPKSFVVALEQNYRSTQNILDAANEIIKLSPEQKLKKLWTENKSGEKVIVYSAIDEAAEARFVADRIISQLNNGSIKQSNKGEDEETEYVYDQVDDDYDTDTAFFDTLISMSGKDVNYERKKLDLEAALDNPEQLKEFAVLYRTNAQSRILEEVLIKYSIPYQLIGSIRFYERKEIKDVLAFLRLILNPNDYFSLERVISIPPRGIGAQSFALIKNKQFNALSGRASASWKEFNRKIQDLRLMDENTTLTQLIDELLLKFDLEDFYRDETEEGESRWENINELKTVAANFDHLPVYDALAEFLAEVALYSETDEIGTRSGVTLMTLHQAKGLEFDTVFIVGVEEGMLPHMRSLEGGSADVAEEIRLAYVGITRARKNLYLTHTHSRKIYGSSYSFKPSRVLEALPEEVVEYQDTWSLY